MKILHDSLSPKEPEQMNSPVSSPKYGVPVWVIVLVLFLFALVVGMGVYIGFQNSFFQTTLPSTQIMLTPSNTPAPETGMRTLRTTMKPDGTWLTYTNTDAGFTLKYPPSVRFDTGDGGDMGDERDTLTIAVEKMSDIPEEYPLGMDRKTAVADREALEKGKAQTIGDFASSDALIPLNTDSGVLNARMNSVLSRFEVCSVLFNRSLTFYPGEFRVRITLDRDEKSIVESMPEFFTSDAKNCGEQMMWVRSADKMGQFLPTLARGEGKGAGQAWYDAFDGIIQTITLMLPATGIPPVVSPTTPSLTQACEVGDNAFCNVLNDIKTSMAGNNYSNVIAYQNTTTVICDPDGMAIALCEGMAKGVVKEGYAIGYNQSEGGIHTREQHLASIASYIAESGPFIYKGSLQDGDKGVIVYLNADGSKLFVLRMKREGNTWRFSTVLVGGTFGDTSFTTLNPSLLE